MNRREAAGSLASCAGQAIAAVPPKPRVLQLVPILPPPFEGLGGYALALGRAIASTHGIMSTYVVGDPSWRVEADGAVRILRKRSIYGMTEALSVRPADAVVQPESTALLVHFVNYGYQKRGCPFWLLRGLVRWRKDVSSRRLVTMFHEVYAFGPPWRSSFWLSPVQRYLACKLARLSDAIVTSLDSYATLLRRWRPDLRVRVLPVVSTVGEPDEVADIADREPILVTFGSAGSRALTYGPHLEELERWCEALGVSAVVDIGPAVPAMPPNVGARPVLMQGVLSPDNVSSWLQRARAGFLAYAPHLLGKSTVFAAYAAHGVVPIVAGDPAQHDGSVRRGQHYVLATWDPPDSTFVGSTIAFNARSWYRDHSLSRQAGIFAQLLTKGTAPV